MRILCWCWRTWVYVWNIRKTFKNGITNLWEKSMEWLWQIKMMQVLKKRRNCEFLGERIQERRRRVNREGVEYRAERQQKDWRQTQGKKWVWGRKHHRNKEERNQYRESGYYWVWLVFVSNYRLHILFFSQIWSHIISSLTISYWQLTATFVASRYFPNKLYTNLDIIAVDMILLHAYAMFNIFFRFNMWFFNSSCVYPYP